MLFFYNILYILFFLPTCVVMFIMSLLKRVTKPWERMGLALPPPHGKGAAFWFHAASVGEVRSLKHLAERLRAQYPDYALIISTMTSGGYQTAVREIQPDTVFMLPLENRFAIRAAIRRYNVKILFITDTELWPNLITAAAGLVPVILLNARISDKTVANYQRFSWIFSPILRSFTYIIAKSETDAERIANLTGDASDQLPAGESAKRTKNILVGGNIKFFLHNAEKPLPAVHGLGGKIAFAASTHRPEEEIFLSCSTFSAFDTIVVAPRHIRRAEEVKATAEAAGFTARLYSAPNNGEKVVIIDELGLLEPVYKLSSKIFVGGSLADIGGHNIFEALQYGKAVAVGPNTYNFNDIVPLAISFGVAVTVPDVDALGRWLADDIESPDFTAFFNFIRGGQEKYFSMILGCIDKCIGV